MAGFIDNPDYWHGRAQQVRSQARDIHELNMRDLRARHELLQIADAYDRIAQHVRETAG
jgi:hypothetical protein